MAPYTPPNPQSAPTASRNVNILAMSSWRTNPAPLPSTNGAASSAPSPPTKGLTRSEVALGQIVHLPDLGSIPQSSVLRQTPDGQRNDIGNHPCVVVGFEANNVVEVKTCTSFGNSPLTDKYPGQTFDVSAKRRHARSRYRLIQHPENLRGEAAGNYDHPEGLRTLHLEGEARKHMACPSYLNFDGEYKIELQHLCWENVKGRCAKDLKLDAASTAYVLAELQYRDAATLYSSRSPSPSSSSGSSSGNGGLSSAGTSPVGSRNVSPASSQFPSPAALLRATPATTAPPQQPAQHQQRRQQQQQQQQPMGQFQSPARPRSWPLSGSQTRHQQPPPMGQFAMVAPSPSFQPLKPRRQAVAIPPPAASNPAPKK